MHLSIHVALIIEYNFGCLRGWIIRRLGCILHRLLILELIGFIIKHQGRLLELLLVVVILVLGTIWFRSILLVVLVLLFRGYI